MEKKKRKKLTHPQLFPRSFQHCPFASHSVYHLIHNTIHPHTVHTKKPNGYNTTQIYSKIFKKKIFSLITSPPNVTVCTEIFYYSSQITHQRQLDTSLLHILSQFTSEIMSFFSPSHFFLNNFTAHLCYTHLQSTVSPPSSFQILYSVLSLLLSVLLSWLWRSAEALTSIILWSVIFYSFIYISIYLLIYLSFSIQGGTVRFFF